MLARRGGTVVKSSSVLITSLPAQLPRKRIRPSDAACSQRDLSVYLFNKYLLTYYYLRRYSLSELQIFQLDPPQLSKKKKRWRMSPTGFINLFNYLLAYLFYSFSKRIICVVAFRSVTAFQLHKFSFTN